jgi:predicted metal-dependent HD superfamily phosphohydrolase
MLCSLNNIFIDSYTKSYYNLFVAILYHDAVYDLSASPGENERASVLYAKEYGKHCLQNIDWDKVELYILATTHMRDLTNATHEEKLIADLDLIGFNDSYLKFSRDNDLVIQEYCSIYSFNDVLKGRLKFLNDWSTKTHLFYTSLVGEDINAKSNMEQEMRKLERIVFCYE